MQIPEVVIVSPDHPGYRPAVDDERRGENHCRQRKKPVLMKCTRHSGPEQTEEARFLIREAPLPDPEKRTPIRICVKCVRKQRAQSSPAIVGGGSTRPNRRVRPAKARKALCSASRSKSGQRTSVTTSSA